MSCQRIAGSFSSARAGSVWMILPVMIARTTITMAHRTSRQNRN